MFLSSFRVTVTLLIIIKERLLPRKDSPRDGCCTQSTVNKRKYTAINPDSRNAKRRYIANPAPKQKTDRLDRASQSRHTIYAHALYREKLARQWANRLVAMVEPETEPETRAASPRNE